MNKRYLIIFKYPAISFFLLIFEIKKNYTKKYKSWKKLKKFFPIKNKKSYK